jgi:monoamine oxidase
MNETIIIVGAGAAGLLAAKELSAKGKTIILLEANNRIGGRIHTMHPPAFSRRVEAGAEFVHGKLPVTLQLLDEARIFYQPVEGQMKQVENGQWQTQDDFTVGWDELMEKMMQLEQDMTIAAFLEEYFHDPEYADLRRSVQRFAEGFDLANIHTASVFAVRDEWMHELDEQFRIPGGYMQLVNYLEQQCRANGCSIRTNCIVKKITWRRQDVCVESADGASFTGNRIIITVPVGILQAPASHSAALQFEPSINEYMEAAANIGFGSVTKILLEFKEPFWTAKSKNIGFVLSEMVVPTWWTQLPDKYPLLTGWLGGPLATAFYNDTDEEILETALQSLALIFKKEISELKEQLTASYISKWHDHEFSLGAYSYSTLKTAEARKLLHTPVKETIFFGGEGIYEGADAGTVEAAFVSALKVVDHLLLAQEATNANIK